MSKMKRIYSVHKAPSSHWVGDGFPVRSLFSYNSFGSEISPFLLLDYAGPKEFEPADVPRGVDVHPHKGFETVTIVYQGELEHRDSSGNHGKISAGDVQWMTAASGILHEEKHSEAFTTNGGTLEMVQLWVNLPAKDKMAPPGYQTLLKEDIPVVSLTEGVSARVIAGELAGAKGAARTFTPVNVWDVKLEPDSRAEIDITDGHTTLLAVLRGEIVVNSEETAKESELVVFEREGTGIGLESAQGATALVLGGEPINESVAGYGPFVMNTQAEIQQAIQDYTSGKFGQLD